MIAQPSNLSHDALQQLLLILQQYWALSFSDPPLFELLVCTAARSSAVWPMGTNAVDEIVQLLVHAD